MTNEADYGMHPADKAGTVAVPDGRVKFLNWGISRTQGEWIHPAWLSIDRFRWWRPTTVKMPGV